VLATCLFNQAREQKVFTEAGGVRTLIKVQKENIH